MKKFLFSAILMISVSIMFSSCGSKSAIEGYEWLEGKWITEDLRYDGDYNCVIFTKTDCRCTSYNAAGEVITDVASLPAQPIEFVTYFNRCLQSDVVDVCGYGIDEAKKQIFWLADFDCKMYMKKIE